MTDSMKNSPGRKRTISGIDKQIHFIKYVYKHRIEIDPCVEKTLINWRQMVSSDDVKSEDLDSLDLINFSKQYLSNDFYSKWCRAYSSHFRRLENINSDKGKKPYTISGRAAEKVRNLANHKKYKGKSIDSIVFYLANNELGELELEN